MAIFKLSSNFLAKTIVQFKIKCVTLHSKDDHFGHPDGHTQTTGPRSGTAQFIDIMKTKHNGQLKAHNALNVLL